MWGGPHLVTVNPRRARRAPLRVPAQHLDRRHVVGVAHVLIALGLEDAAVRARVAFADVALVLLGEEAPAAVLGAAHHELAPLGGLPPGHAHLLVVDQPVEAEHLAAQLLPLLGPLPDALVRGAPLPLALHGALRRRDHGLLPVEEHGLPVALELVVDKGAGQHPHEVGVGESTAALHALRVVHRVEEEALHARLAARELARAAHDRPRRREAHVAADVAERGGHMARLFMGAYRGKEEDAKFE